MSPLLHPDITQGGNTLASKLHQTALIRFCWRFVLHNFGFGGLGAAVWDARRPHIPTNSGLRDGEATANPDHLQCSDGNSSLAADRQ